MVGLPRRGGVAVTSSPPVPRSVERGNLLLTSRSTRLTSTRSRLPISSTSGGKAPNKTFGFCRASAPVVRYQNLDSSTQKPVL